MHARDVSRLLRITALTGLGFSVEEVRAALDDAAWSPSRSIDEHLARREHRTSRVLSSLQGLASGERSPACDGSHRRASGPPMRRLATLLLVPGLATADIRLELAMPELRQLEPVYHLDRGSSKRSSDGIAASLGVGVGGDDGERGLVGEGTLRAGMRSRQFALAGSSDVAIAANELVRGRHAGWLELRSDDRSVDAMSLVGTVAASLEHGEARGLQPVSIGPGEREHAAASSTVVIGLGHDKDDFVLGALVAADGSFTHWRDAPLLDRAQRGAFGLGLVMAPFDGELPHGRMDILRARVEHATITHDVWAAGGPVRDTQVRTIEVMTGLHELTGWIDHALLFAVTAQVGGVWIDSDRAGGAIQNTFFKMQLGTHLKWRTRKRGLRELGFAWAREPGPTPDGRHHVTDWRLELAAAAEDARLALSVRGGISWVSHASGGDSDPDTVKRYGSQVDAFVKLGMGVEVGGYHVMTYEPRVAGDPWSAPRQFVTELGLMARWRPSTY